MSNYVNPSDYQILAESFSDSGAHNVIVRDPAVRKIHLVVDGKIVKRNIPTNQAAVLFGGWKVSGRPVEVYEGVNAAFDKYVAEVVPQAEQMVADDLKRREAVAERAPHAEEAVPSAAGRRPIYTPPQRKHKSAKAELKARRKAQRRARKAARR